MLTVVTLAVVAAFLAGAAPAAAASAPPVRQARVSDAATRPFPESYTESWRLHAVDPASGRWLIVRVETFPTPTLEAVVFDGTTAHGSYHPMLARGRTTLLDVADLRHVSGGWHLSLSYPTSKAELRLVGRPGVTVGPWRLGRQPVNQTPAQDFETASFTWSALVPAGRLDGWLDLDHFRIDLRGWRGYLDHTWGKLKLEQPTYDHWDFAASHPRTGESWVLQGLEAHPVGTTRSLVAGDDRRWTGVLLHATAQGTSWCRPRVRRSGWFTAGNGFDGPFPDRVTAGCGGHTVTFRRWYADFRWGVVNMTQFVRGSGLLPDRSGFIEHVVPG